MCTRMSLNSELRKDLPRQFILIQVT